MKRQSSVGNFFRLGLAITFWISIVLIPVLFLSWGISRMRWDIIHVVLRNGACFSAASDSGSFLYEASVVDRHVTAAGMPPPPPDPWVEFHHQSGSPPMTGVMLLSPARISYWVLIVISAVTAFGIRVLRVRVHLNETGTCATCGYDLRAHKPGDRCPECGTAVPADRTP
jgi:hypothetical protein